MMNKALFSSNRKDWETPQDLFDSLNSEFHFTLDAVANSYNHKCDKYYTVEDNDWSNETVFINPPYGDEIKSWVRKAYYQNCIHNNLIVMLLPARTDTKWFHAYINNHAEIRFLKGRIKFVGAKHSAPFPSMVVIFHPQFDSIPEVEPDFKRLFSSLYTQIEEHGYNSMDLLPSSIQYLSQIIKEQDDLREAVGRVRCYLRYKDEIQSN